MRALGRYFHRRDSLAPLQIKTMCDDPFRYIVSYLGAASDEGVNTRTLLPPGPDLGAAGGSEGGGGDREEAEGVGQKAGRDGQAEAGGGSPCGSAAWAFRCILLLVPPDVFRGPSAHQPDAPNCGAHTGCCVQVRRTS